MAHRYDLIVIGNDLSSLVAAEMASHEGFKTLLIQEGDIPDAFSESGFTFNVDPLPWAGLGPGELCLHPYLEDPLFQSNRTTLKLLDPGLQVILPSCRVDIHFETEQLIRDIEREFSGSTDLLWDLYDSIWKTSLAFAKYARENPSLLLPGALTSPHLIRLLVSLYRERSKFLKKLGSIQQEPLLLCFEAQLSFLSSLHNEGLFLTAPYALSLPLQGLYYPVGGKHIAVNTIRERLLSRGGDIARGCKISHVGLGTEQCEVQWMTGESAVKGTGKRLIISAKWKNLDAHLLGDKRFRSLAKRIARRRESAFFPFTLHVGLLEKGIPEKLSEYAILITDDIQSGSIAGPLFLELSGRGDTGRAPDGKRALSATIFIGESPDLLSDSDLREFAAGILQKLDGLLPFLSENTEFMDVDRSIDLSRKYQEVVNRKFRITRRLFTGFGALSNRTPVKNVFLTGDDLLGLGFIGDILSGANAVRLASGGL